MKMGRFAAVTLIFCASLADRRPSLLPQRNDLPDIYTPVAINTPGKEVKEHGAPLPLRYTFDFTLSIGWAATAEEIETFKKGMTAASALLFNITAGQMRFRKIEIFNNKANWENSDVRVSDQPNVLPQAIGAFADQKKGRLRGRRYTHISMTKFPIGNDAPEDGIEGGRDWGSKLAAYSFLHEFFHYACGLEDEADQKLYADDRCIMRGDSTFKKTPNGPFQWEAVMASELCADKHPKNNPAVPFSCWDQVIARYPKMKRPAAKPAALECDPPEFSVK